MDDEPHRGIETRILREIAETKRKIAELQADQRSLERILVRIRGENLGAQDVTRKNSINRLLVENAILKALSERSGRPVSLSLLWQAARLTLPGLKQSTFRSYLNRLREKGLIQSSGHGKWHLLEIDTISHTNTDT